MADRALTADAVLAGLQDIRLPPDAAGGLAAEVLAAVSVGLALALLLGMVLRLLTRTAHGPGRPRQAQAPAAEMSDERQRLALLHRLKATRPDVFARLREDLYRPGGLPELAALKAEAGHD